MEQQLCIKNDEKCPLYDVGIGEINNENYEYDNNAKIYYNNENYDGEKIIIGKLILNDGQPCYNLNEKLWRKFYDEEQAENHLKCDLEIFGKLTDDRYQNRGDITYKKIYEDNLSTTSKDYLLENINNEKVSLYKRQFLGIDKECDEEKNISKKKYDKLRKNQNMESILLIVEAAIIFSFFLGLLIFFITGCIFIRKSSMDEKIFYMVLFAFLIIYMVFLLVCIICHSVFIGRIIHNDLFYDCSDSLTNEVLRQENKNTKKTILWTAINLGGDVFFLVYNGLVVLIFYIINKCKYCVFSHPKRSQDNQVKIQEKNKINSDDIYNKPVKETVVEDSTNNRDNSQNQKIDLDVPPPANPSNN